MLLDRLWVTSEEFEAGTGWSITEDGACLGDVCVPLQSEVDDDIIDVTDVAEQMGMPLVHDPDHDMWALGPWAGSGHALASAEAPELVLPDLDGAEFRLSSLRGQKVVLVAWAPY